MTGYMLDTNLFNDLLGGEMAISKLCDMHIFVTHVQHDELRATQNKNAEKAAELLRIVEALLPTQISTHSAVWDVSRWDQSKWTDPEGAFTPMLAKLRELDAATGKKPRNPANQPRDILIAEASIKNGLTLLSGDKNLRTVTREFGGEALDITEFLATGS